MASSERDEQRRSAFRAYVRSIVSERFVFVDECSTNISLSPIYARAPRGERAHGKAPRNWGKNVSLICAIDSEGVKPSMSVEGAVDGKAFESYLEHFLAPKLERGHIMVMDNLSVHKSKRVQRLIEEAGATLLFLPPYSPDMNPIEGAFSKVKSVLRKVAARTREALVEATGRALDTRSPPKTSAASIPIADTVCLCSRCENRSRLMSHAPPNIRTPQGHIQR
jgi:transposase